MSSALNVHNWWECFGNELWAMNLRCTNLVPYVITAVGTKLKLKSVFIFSKKLTYSFLRKKNQREYKEQEILTVSKSNFKGL